MVIFCRFNTERPEGGWSFAHVVYRVKRVSTHSRLKAAEMEKLAGPFWDQVSTHSRLKAAGIQRISHNAVISFNTQPPEGG